MNFIKNFFFDIRDLVITIAIISLLVFSITWKINDTMNVDFADPLKSGAILINPESTTEAPIVSVDPEPTTEEPTTEPENTEATEETETTEPTSSVADVYIDFVVKEGEYGHTIAKNLVDSGLISDAREFVIRANELGLDTKLRQGKYKFKSSDSLDLIIKVLAGQSRGE